MKSFGQTEEEEEEEEGRQKTEEDRRRTKTKLETRSLKSKEEDEEEEELFAPSGARLWQQGAEAQKLEKFCLRALRAQGEGFFSFN